MAPRSRRGRPDGFTLLEMTLVLFLAGLLAALALPSFRGTLGSARLRSGGADVRDALSRARALAIRDGATRAVSFDLPAGEFSLPGEGSPRALPEGVRFESVRVGAEGGRAASVRFFPDGGGEDAEILLASPEGGRVRIRVEGLTGVVEAGT